MPRCSRVSKEKRTIARPLVGARSSAASTRDSSENSRTTRRVPWGESLPGQRRQAPLEEKGGPLPQGQHRDVPAGTATTPGSPAPGTSSRCRPPRPSSAASDHPHAAAVGGDTPTSPDSFFLVETWARGRGPTLNFISHFCHTGSSISHTAVLCEAIKRSVAGSSLRWRRQGGKARGGWR